ncbi:hypothetical protein Tco_0906723 [Tanacetum coccineum]|uniref:Uncharacterized protein n=1 Tax=Tanacetum coccineum TaxID=301880 RepID=A0ABQ5CJL3_9ASTR
MFVANLLQERDDPNITIEEYVRYDEDINDHIFFETKFSTIVYEDALTSELEFSSEPTIQKLTFLLSVIDSLLTNEPTTDQGLEKFSVSSVRRLIDERWLLEVSTKTRWINVVPIKVNVHAWKVRKNTSIGARDAKIGHGNEQMKKLKASYGVTTLHELLIMEYLVNISKRRAFWSFNEDILKINDSDYQYAVSIKEDTAYPFLHSPKTTKETSSIRHLNGGRCMRVFGYKDVTRRCLEALELKGGDGGACKMLGDIRVRSWKCLRYLVA